MQEMFEKIIDALYKGNSLKKELEKHRINPRAFFDYINGRPDRQKVYAQAQCARSELCVEEILDIADHEADPIRARNMIDARRWYASKMQPHKYGDKIDLNVNATVDLSAALLEAKQRITLPTIDATPLPSPQKFIGPPDEVDIFS